MEITIREYSEKDLELMFEIWNEVIDSGIAFPQTEKLIRHKAAVFFAEQSFTGLAVNAETQEILGLYTLHPNNVGRCGHLSNASYAVKSTARGLHIGEKLVRHSIKKSKELGFKILQFNAVVKTNYGALKLYEKLGFVRLGTIPGGFLMKNGKYEDIILFYHNLNLE